MAKLSDCIKIHFDSAEDEFITKMVKRRAKELRGGKTVSPSLAKKAVQDVIKEFETDNSEIEAQLTALRDKPKEAPKTGKSFSVTREGKKETFNSGDTVSIQTDKGMVTGKIDDVSPLRGTFQSGGQSYRFNMASKPVMADPGGAEFIMPERRSQGRGEERRKDVEGRKRVDSMTQEEMREELLTDTLTGLPNRRAYDEAPKKDVQGIADVDSLKWVNDNIGHKAGDALLQQYAEAVHKTGVEAYRVGGDEIYLQADTRAEVDQAMESANAYLASNPIIIEHPDGKQYKISVGFSYGTGRTIEQADNILKQRKQEREKEGKRAARGERPPGFVGVGPNGIKDDNQRERSGKEGVDTQGAISKLKKTLTDETGSSQIVDDIINHGIELRDKGVKSFGEFARSVKSKFSEVWDKVKKHLRSLWNTLQNEKGEVTIKGEDPYETFAKQYKSRKTQEAVDRVFTKEEQVQISEGPTIEALNRDSDDIRDRLLKVVQGYEVSDMRWWDRAFSNPQWLAETYKSMKTALGIEKDAQESRTKLTNQTYKKNHKVGKEELGSLADLQYRVGRDRKKMKAMRSLVWKWDGKKFPQSSVPTSWYKLSKKEDGPRIEIDQKHYEEVNEYLKKQGVGDDVRKTFVALRKIYDEYLVDSSNLMFKEDPQTDIEEFRSQIGKINNYFPHRRVGGAYITIEKRVKPSKDNLTGRKVIYREHYEPLNKVKNRPEQVQKRAQKWLEKAMSDGIEVDGETIDGKLSDYVITRPRRVDKVPDEVFFSVPIENMQQIIDIASGRIEREKGVDIGPAISKAVADVFKSRGWASHALQRKGIPGHDTDDIFGITFDYIAGYNGFKTKMERARAHSENLNKIKADRRSEEFRYVSKYVKDMLENQNRVDKVVDAMRTVFYVKYIGGVIKSGLVNLTQNIVMAQPILSMHTKQSAQKLSKAMYDVRKALYSKEALTNREVKYDSLTKEESRAVNDLVEIGVADDQYLKELIGNLPGSGAYGAIKRGVDLLGKPMQIAERFNRVSTGLAAYRVGVADKKMSHEQSIEFAKSIVEKAHFIYGKINLPSTMRGGTVRKTLRAAYTFRSFQHNFILAMRDLVFNQGKEGKIAAAKVMRNFFLMSGLAGLPFFKDLLQAVMNSVGKDDEDAMTLVRSVVPGEMMKDFVTYGAPGLAGMDFTGSLGMEFPKAWSDILGVPYSALYEDPKNMIESWKSGQHMRAMVESPITPLAIRNAERAVRLYTEGQISRSGEAINDPGKAGPRKITGTEAVLKGVVGIQPTTVSKGREAFEAQRRLKEVLTEKKTKMADKMVNAIQRNDEEGIEEALADMQKWNETAAKQGKYYKLIDIKQSVKSRLDDNIKKIPTIQRGRVMEIYKEWE